MPASSLAPEGPRRALAVTLVGLALVALTLPLFWPLGVVIGLACGVVVVLGLGRQQDREARTAAVADLFAAAGDEPRPVRSAALLATTAPVALQPAPPRPPVVEEGGVRADLDRLKTELGDDYRDFARAAQLVVSTQYASAARLQRDLQLPYSRARRLLADLETQHFVGPATGTLPRQVLMPKDRLPEVERMLAGV
ncbi:DNA translocase FtsK [Amnibacterium endophyticum]|uniref:DNA translocase FtsK n=1 Tax=Amnibacterium endophyticum TaxID=2109337 RepID=A0ABW4LCQ8_9MICO